MPRKKKQAVEAPKSAASAEEKPVPSLAGMESPKENVWEEDLAQLQSPGGPESSSPAQIVRGIVCGTMAFAINQSNKKIEGDSDASHKWSCYVRGPDDYDISTFIKQVVFSLHPSFNNSVRPFKSPPYEIHEEGWGEFDIGIKLHFWPDSQLRPVEFIHQLKLYPTDDAAATQTVSKKPVVNEIYHELIFTQPVSRRPLLATQCHWAKQRTPSRVASAHPAAGRPILRRSRRLQSVWGPRYSGRGTSPPWRATTMTSARTFDPLMTRRRPVQSRRSRNALVSGRGRHPSPLMHRWLQCTRRNLCSENLCSGADTVMNLTIEMRERLKAVAVETAQIKSDILALGGTPVEPAKPPEPSTTTPQAASSKRPSSQGAQGGAEVKPEATGRGKRKSKGRKR